jgi:hypothetical protein
MDTSVKLVQASQRRKDQLLPYETTLVSLLLNATNDLVDDAREIVQGANNTVSNVYSNQPESSLKAAFLMHHLRIQRNKRALLIYHNERLMRYSIARWLIARLRAVVEKYGNAGIPEDIRASLTVADNEFVLAYRQLVQKFNRENSDLDLVNYNPDPPKNLLVCVKGIFAWGLIRDSVEEFGRGYDGAWHD